jgi:hypothetical protein
LSKQYYIWWRKCQKYFYVTHWQKKISLTFLTSLYLYIFTIWKCIAYNFFCRDGIYFDKILVSEYKLFKRSNTKGIIRSRMPKKNRQYYVKRTHNDIHNTTHKTKDWTREHIVVKSGALEGYMWAVHAPLVAPVVLLSLEQGISYHIVCLQLPETRMKYYYKK